MKTKLKSNISNLIARSIVSLFIYGLTVLIILDSKMLMSQDVSSISMYVFLFGANALIYWYGYKEPNIIKFKNESLIFYSIPLIIPRTIHKTEISGFSLSTRTYRTGKAKSYILYLKSGKKIFIVDYHFNNFDLIQRTFKKHGVRFFGKEQERYRWLLKRKFKYDISE
ncbi:hypothetical protein KFE94_00215 [bacterium SCSIO 12643]|nr:hypothetical protein KFE94_00215 [bacterium SCSIO 12643]